MDRLTYDFPFNGGHCWQIHGSDNLECREVCERQGENGCIECPIAKAFDRLAAYENTGLEPEEIEPLCDMDRRAKMAEMLRIEEYFGVSIDRLRELVEADRDGRCVVLPSRGYTDQDGKNALKSAMSTCFYHNNPVTRYIADAVAEKLTREAAEAALEGELNG